MTDRPGRDMLASIMDMQAAFQRTVPDGVVSFKEANDDELLMAMVRTQTLACIDELMEAMNETGWKPWASSNHFNVEAFRSELIDAFRFWLNLVHISGMSAEGVFMLYQESMLKTRARVDNGYDGVSTKCPGCKRAYDDKAVSCKPRKDENPTALEILDGPTPAWCQVYGYVTADGQMMAHGTTGWYVVST